MNPLRNFFARLLIATHLVTFLIALLIALGVVAVAVFGILS